jgi:hypothetical protein
MKESEEHKQVSDLIAKLAFRWPKLLSIEQTAEYLSISPKSIRNGLGPRAPKPFPVRPKRFGRRVLFDIDDLQKFAESL